MFTFLKYVAPTWYYNLATAHGKRYWANYERLSDAEKATIETCRDYSSEQVVRLDKAYQGWVKGVIINEGCGLETTHLKPTLTDEYVFIRRYFNPVWILFILLIRLLELNNPVKEVFAAFRAMKTKRINIYRKKVDWKRRIDSFDSGLVKKSPKVSVIIPTLNRYQYLKDVLADLEKQDYKNFEVLIVDQSEPFGREFYDAFDLDLKVWYQNEKALWLARNSAIEKSAGEYILLFDDDSRVDPDWISAHLKCLDFFQAEISSGVSISAVGAKVPETYSHYKWGDQIDTGNVLLKKDVFRRVGLFDRQFEKQRQGDGEFGLRAYLAGFKNISNPDAQRLHLKVGEGGLREMGSWDGWRPKKFFAPRPIPSVLYLTRKYFGNRAAAYQIITSVLPSVIPYRFKRNNFMLALGSFAALFLLPLLSVSIIRSWREASRKLREGAKIPRLSV